MHQNRNDNRTASRIAGLLQAGEVSAVDLLQDYVARIKGAADQSIFIGLTEDRAFREAAASDARRRSGQPRSPWDGVPVAWKDLFDLKGETTTAGAAVYRDAPTAEADADVVAACERGGLICLGKTNLSEFAYSGLGLNPHFGTPRNPAGKAEARVPGGSSSGSAVAVAAGLAPIAIGSDTAGSVRVPAGFCGIAGFKSTQARYSTKGVFPLSSSLDSLGSFALSVEDLIGIDALMRGQWTEVGAAPRPADLDFIIPESIVFDAVEPDILARFADLERALKEAGARIERRPFPIFDEVARLFQAHGTLTVAEAYTFHETLLKSDKADRMDQRVRERMMSAGQFSVQDYIRLHWARTRLRQETAELLGDRFLLFPTTPMTAPEIAPLDASPDLFKSVNLMALRNTMPGSYLETPGVSLPIGTDEKGLPIGALVSAPYGQDDRVLAAARSMEAVIEQARQSTA